MGDHRHKEDRTFDYNDAYQDKFTEVYLIAFAAVYRDMYETDYKDSLIKGCGEDEADARARVFATERAHELATVYAMELIDELIQ